MTKTRAPRLVAILFSAAALAAAAPAGAVDFGFHGMDLHLAASFPSDWDTGPTAGISFNVAELVDGLYLYPGIFYSQAERTDSVPGAGEISLEITTIAVGAEVRYFLDQEQRGFYFGGGAYLNRQDLESVGRGAFGDVELLSTDQTVAGGMGVAGYRIPLGARTTASLEARYNLVSDFAGPSVGLVLGF
ncbi:MAG: hypothetical protein ACLF0P_05980 [Thermoanaerobaculia bacterium]